MQGKGFGKSSSVGWIRIVRCYLNRLFLFPGATNPTPISFYATISEDRRRLHVTQSTIYLIYSSKTMALERGNPDRVPWQFWSSSVTSGTCQALKRIDFNRKTLGKRSSPVGPTRGGSERTAVEQSCCQSLSSDVTYSSTVVFCCSFPLICGTGWCPAVYSSRRDCLPRGTAGLNGIFA